jgi:histidinol phosphatase-like PHP family hydrolase
MIDLHTHTLFSDGELLPSELVRRAQVKGYEAIALTDHVDSSNIDFVLPRIVNICKKLGRHWPIKVLPGVEITHAPLEEMGNLVRFARKNGAKIVIVHGETTSEPVIPGTNRRAIESGCDILAHPGKISKEDVRLAKDRGVCLEITSRKSHSASNRHVLRLGNIIGAKLVLNTDTHAPGDLISDSQAIQLLRRLGCSKANCASMYNNSKRLAHRKS